MHNINGKIRTFLRDEEGLTTVEYAVAGGMIAAVTIVAFQALGLTVCDIIDFLTTTLQTVNLPGGFTQAPAGCAGG